MKPGYFSYLVYLLLTSLLFCLLWMLLVVFFLIKKLFIYFSLCWVFVAAHRLSLDVDSGGGQLLLFIVEDGLQ